MDNRFREIILACQSAREKYGFEYEQKYSKMIAQFSDEIKEDELIDKCEDTHFAKQLCMMNSLSFDRTK